MTSEERAAPSGDHSVELLRAEIEKTRGELSETVEAIEHRLSRQELANQAKDAAKRTAQHAIASARGTFRDVSSQATSVVRDATTQARSAVRDASSNVADSVVSGIAVGSERVGYLTRSAGETANVARLTAGELIRQAPAAAALTGLSLGWLLLANLAGRSTRTRWFGREVAVRSLPPLVLAGAGLGWLFLNRPGNSELALSARTPQAAVPAVAPTVVPTVSAVPSTSDWRTINLEAADSAVLVRGQEQPRRQVLLVVS